MKKYIDCKNKIEYKKIKEIAQEIKNGSIVVFPTETVYGIGTNGLKEDAIKKLYKIKQRPLNKPITLLVSNMKMIEMLVKDITDLEYKLIKTFMPGPLTIILKKKNIVPNALTNNNEFVGIRMPENEIALKLIEYSKIPIATPSANISGKPAGTDIQQIINDFGNKVDYYIDGGESKLKIASTIVQVIDEKINILREGSIKKEEIYKCYEE